jgi:hypothetical protein
MKTRDFVIIGAVLFCLMAFGWLESTAPVPGPVPHRQTLRERVTKAAAIWWLSREPARDGFQELPAAVVNAPADRLLGPDGELVIDHGDGW